MRNISMTSVYDITSEIITKIASDIDDEVFRQVAAEKGYSRCDRDALLALAEEMDNACPESASVAIGCIDDYALRIREALGVIE